MGALGRLTSSFEFQVMMSFRGDERAEMGGRPGGEMRGLSFSAMQCDPVLISVDFTRNCSVLSAFSPAPCVVCESDWSVVMSRGARAVILPADSSMNRYPGPFEI